VLLSLHGANTHLTKTLIMGTVEPITLYVCSAGRSGSTLLDLLMGSHHDCFSLGEIEHLPKNMSLDTPCSCGEPARSCPFWRQVAERILSVTGVDWYRTPYQFNLGLYKASNVLDRRHQTRAYLSKYRLILGMKWFEYAVGIRLPYHTRITRSFDIGVQNTARLFDAVREVSGRPVLLDSSKEYRKAIGLYRERPDETRLLILTRDGRGVFNSKRRDGFSLRSSIFPWIKYYRNALPLIEKQVPAQHRMRLRYEDLARDATGTLKAVCDFVGLEFDPAMLRFREAEHHILNGNDMRLGTGNEVRLDERWRTQLTSRDLAIFKSLGGERMNRRLGYRDGIGTSS
jgi:hypothetical protein